jgi:hypothetical protein
LSYTAEIDRNPFAGRYPAAFLVLLPVADSTEIRGECHGKNTLPSAAISHSITTEKIIIILDITTTYRYTFAQCGRKWDGVERRAVHVPREL